MRKSLLTTLLLLTGFYTAFSQVPYISNIDIVSGEVGKTVTITGGGFSSTGSELVARFGGAIATITSSTPSLIEATVPANATFDHITITNLNNGLTATSSELFSLEFGGSGFNAGNLSQPPVVSTGQNAVFGPCLCDFNGDGMSDLAVANNHKEVGEQAVVNVFTNSSTIDNLNLATRLDIPLASETRYTACNDIDGDGKADLIATQGGSGGTRIFTYRNTSSGATISFVAGQILELPTKAGSDTIRNVNRVELADMDKDGLLDIVATNDIENSIDIFENTSSSGTISFNATPYTLFVSGANNTAGLETIDLNGDGLEDIALTQLQDNDLFILTNMSGEGNFKFSSAQSFTTANFSMNDVKAGDMDGDGLPDLVATDIGDKLEIFINTTASVGGAINFASPVQVEVNSGPWASEIADLNGDGKLDIVTSSTIASNRTITILINSSLGASVTFDRFDIATPDNTQNLTIGDMDGDARPDLVFAHNIGASSPGEILVILNKNCITPKITPSNDQVICSNTNLTLEATQTIGGNYSWELADIATPTNFVEVQNSSDHTFDVLTYINPDEGGLVRVTLTTDAGACAAASDAVTLNVNAATATTPVVTTNSPLCVGDQLVLSTTATGVTSYEWTGPDGFQSTDAAPTINNFQLENAGRYSLTVISGVCRSEAGTGLVEVKSLPFIQIDANNQPTFCSGQTKQLTVSEFSGFTYLWTKDGNNMANSDTTVLGAVEAGTYTAIITETSATNCSFESAPMALTTITQPVAAIDAVNKRCINLPLGFKATSDSAGGFSLNHSWDFGDASANEVGDSVSHSYSAPQQYTVVLTSTYDDIPECNDTEQLLVNIVNTTNVSIETPDGTEKCPSDSLLVQLPQNYESFAWWDGSTGFNTYVKTISGQNSVDISVDWTDDAGCMGTSNLTVTNFANSELTVDVTGRSSALLIENDTVELPEETKFVDLVAAGGTDYQWEPVLVIENANSASVTVFPSTTYTNVTATGTTPSGCRESKRIILFNNFVIPRKTFSPNGDGIGFECWEILNKANVSGCLLHIFDSKGSLLKNEIVETDPTDDCAWDGFTQGAPAPEGVYYFVLKCTDSELSRTGSILLAR